MSIKGLPDMGNGAFATSSISYLGCVGGGKDLSAQIAANVGNKLANMAEGRNAAAAMEQGGSIHRG